MCSESHAVFGLEVRAQPHSLIPQDSPSQTRAAASSASGLQRQQSPGLRVERWRPRRSFPLPSSPQVSPGRTGPISLVGGEPALDPPCPSSVLGTEQPPGPEARQPMEVVRSVCAFAHPPPALLVPPSSCRNLSCFLCQRPPGRLDVRTHLTCSGSKNRESLEREKRW